MACPFAGEEAHEDEDDDQGPGPSGRVPSKPVRPMVLAERAKTVVDVGKAALLAEAEEIVTRAAEAIPLGAGRGSLAEALRRRGPIAVGVGAVAGVAIRAVAKGFAGGGFHFPALGRPGIPQFVR